MSFLWGISPYRKDMDFVMGFRFGFIACGNMQSIIIRSVINNGIADPAKIHIFEPSDANFKVFGDMGAVRSEDYNDLIAKSDIIFFGVKPQVIDTVLTGIDASKIGKGKTFVSIVTGVSSGYLENALGGSPAIRVMPNTPMLIGKGAVALAKNNRADKKVFDLVADILRSCAHVEIMDETLLNAATAVNGSGPAYFYRFADIMAKFGEKCGMDYHQALNLAVHTMAGAAEMLMTTGLEPAELERQVMSPGGTTIASFQGFDQADLDKAIEAGMKKCLDRAGELSR